MEQAYLQKAVVGATGMAIGVALVAMIRVAAVDGVENARIQHLADVASGRMAVPRVVARGDLECPNVAATQGQQVR